MRYPSQPTTDQGNIIGSRLANEIEHRFDGAMRILSKDDQRDSSIAELLAGTGDVVNVKSFGATGDGSTDDTAAIQAAITLVLGLSGGTVLIPGGNYVVKASLIVGSNLWIRGVGEDTFIDFSSPTVDPDNLFEFSGASIDDLHISDMRIRGPSTDAGDASAFGVGIYLTTTTNQERIRIERVRAERWRYGIFLRADTGQAEGPQVTNCWLDECSHSGLRVANSRKALIHGNFVDGDRTGIGDDVDAVVGIFLSPVVSGQLGNLHPRINNNAVYNCSIEGINVHAHYATVVGNVLDGIGQTGILFEPMLQTSPTDADAEHVSVISGNTVRNALTNGIAIRHDPANNTRASGRLSITGNSVTGGVTGIRIGQGGATTQGPLDIAVSNNFCYAQSSKGIQLVDAENITLAGNWCGETGDAGLSIEGASKRISVSGGFYSADNTDSDSIRVADSSKYVVITGAMISSCDRAGVNISSTADFVLVTGNIFVDDLGVPTTNNAVRVSSSGTNIFARDNLADGLTSVEYNGSTFRPVVTLADDATPTVDGGKLFKTGGTTTITDLDDGVEGQEIKILSEHAITITDGTNILLSGSVNYVMAAGDTLTLEMFNDQVWEETSRKVN